MESWSYPEAKKKASRAWIINEEATVEADLLPQVEIVDCFSLIGDLFRGTIAYIAFLLYLLFHKSAIRKTADVPDRQKK